VDGFRGLTIDAVGHQNGDPPRANGLLAWQRKK
jgi:hypothetical protein